MSASSKPALYQGHRIFRNQPPYTYFNKSFEDPTDALFLGLNEIDPYFLQPEQLLDDAAFRITTLRDPRTQEEVSKVVYDYTRKPKPYIFRGGAKSNMNKMEHLVGLRILKAWQEESEVNEADLIVWRRMENKRMQEKPQMLKFVYDWEHVHKERMYEPAKTMVALYKHWYEQIVNRLLLRHEQDFTFNTHAGLPQVRLCKDIDLSEVELTEVKLLGRKGKIPIWREHNADCKRMQHNLVAYAELYANEEYEFENLFEKELELSKAQSDSDEVQHRIWLPLESLLFLLTAGDYIDLPMEVLLEFEQQNDSDKKFATFDKPLPARQCGWHTHTKIVEHAYTAYQSMSEGVSWLRFEQEKVHVEAAFQAQEILAMETGQEEFKPQDFTQYLQNNLPKYKKLPGRVKTNAVLVSWQLAKPDSAKSIELYTTLKQSPALDETASNFIDSFSIKLEYKQQFGCEMMTKYELLSAWWQLKLLNTSSKAKCLRIAADSFETQLLESLSLPRIEKQLHEIYHISMPQLLKNLLEFLKLLLNVPAGKYLLRFNPKFSEKLLLCAPAQEITQNTISLHALLKEKPSDLLFMTQSQFLPIADDLCSVLHTHHNVMPCAFLPQTSKKKKKSPKNLAPFNDRIYILRRVQETRQRKQEKIKQHDKVFKKRKKTEQKARRRKRIKLEKAKKQQEEADAQELEKEIEFDKKLFT